MHLIRQLQNSYTEQTIQQSNSIRVATVQGLSGSGSLLLGAALIKRYFPRAKVLISNPTWDVHLFSFLCLTV
ncbi:unnamed protein product [Trifolium pratense]|uniref:Uncharacterized protein n=1 Tax=Trifolium pratense TaxID=57577 RepID=A0ACB0JKN6_TRIPR|nr:unnamed protein product [Trifolium pratense]